MPTAAFTAAACRIARLERKKFDAVMASGEYNCAPIAPQGMPRIFEIPDLISLYLFTRLIERGRTVKQAALVACQTNSQMKNATNNGLALPNHVAIAYDMIGNSFVTVGDEANPKASGAGTGYPMLWSEMWNIANIKAEIDKGLAEENRIAGSADDE